MGVAVHSVAHGGVSLVHQRTLRQAQPGELGATGQREGWLATDGIAIGVDPAWCVHLRARLGVNDHHRVLFDLEGPLRPPGMGISVPLGADEQPDADRVGQFRRFVQLHQLRPSRSLADRVSRLDRAGLGRASFSHGNMPFHHRDGREHRLLHAAASAEKRKPRRLHRAAGRAVPLGFLPTLLRRNHRVVRLGAAHVEPAGTDVRSLDAG